MKLPDPKELADALERTASIIPAAADSYDDYGTLTALARCLREAHYSGPESHEGMYREWLNIPVDRWGESA